MRSATPYSAVTPLVATGCSGTDGHSAFPGGATFGWGGPCADGAGLIAGLYGEPATNLAFCTEGEG